ncbi:hypothetical protein LZQ00_04605 [Sphingobacterium sp. SRCM116780]|uniref:hypothetical protein n=1 Tax=Sphingobacterium sp. SRCM116780 TaxID=2907623 RepID=UPI001F23E53E|nr:hypothetical protein [Sphingobacterium sp. SRCM116780]UIR57096.1 hypothetical protein LZQ00_04605 [Sphingobacterium sp. SRCM116780]
MTLEERINHYNKSFGFLENPEDFDFNLSPERIIYKNEALRTGNRDLYASYLGSKYPMERPKELADFDNQVGRVAQVDKNEVSKLFEQTGANLLKSDIDFRDQDAVFHTLKVPAEDVSWHLENNEEDLIQVTVTLEQAFQSKTTIYLIK